MRLVCANSLNQGLRVGGTDLMVDIQAIGLTANGDHLGAQLMEHLGRNVVSGAMRGINHNFQAFERQVIGESALAKFNIAPCGVVKATGLAKVG